jgi:tetratricopeptide (TPR) repeat protein
LVTGFARGQEGRASDVRVALGECEARREISLLPAGAARRLLELQLAMGEFGFAKTNRELQTGLSHVDALMAQWPARSIERVCVLASRGDFEADLDRPDLAVADQREAYQAARAAGWTDAAASIALSLATTYRRSGLWPDAEEMVGEALAYATDRQLTWFRGLAMLTSGQIYSNEQRWDEAFAALTASRELLISVNDTLTAALAALPMCDALINSGRIAEARWRCAGEFATFAGFGRSDLVTDSLIYQARIDLLDKRYLSALNVLNSVLTTHLDDVPSRYKSRLYRERSDALSGLGREREAAADLRRSTAPADASALSERKRTTAVLTGMSRARALEAANRVLALENATQRQQIESQRLVRQLSVGLAIATLMVSSLFAYLLYLGSHHRRAVERHAIVLNTPTTNLSDTVMLIDRDQRVEFANRPIGGDDRPVGHRLQEFVPLEAREQFRQALDSVFAERRPAEFAATWPGPDGLDKHIEQRLTPVTNESDQLIGATLRSADVTTRRRLEDTL